MVGCLIQQERGLTGDEQTSQPQNGSFLERQGRTGRLGNGSLKTVPVLLETASKSRLEQQWGDPGARRSLQMP